MNKRFKTSNRKKENLEISDLDYAVNELFSFASHSHIQKGMWDWLKATVCGNYNTDLEESERVLILLIYEHLEILLSVAANRHELTKSTINEIN